FLRRRRRRSRAGWAAPPGNLHLVLRYSKLAGPPNYLLRQAEQARSVGRHCLPKTTPAEAFEIDHFKIASAAVGVQATIAAAGRLSGNHCFSKGVGGELVDLAPHESTAVIPRAVLGWAEQATAG